MSHIVFLESEICTNPGFRPIAIGRSSPRFTSFTTGQATTGPSAPLGDRLTFTTLITLITAEGETNSTNANGN